MDVGIGSNYCTSTGVEDVVASMLHYVGGKCRVPINSDALKSKILYGHLSPSRRQCLGRLYRSRQTCLIISRLLFV